MEQQFNNKKKSQKAYLFDRAHQLYEEKKERGGVRGFVPPETMAHFHIETFGDNIECNRYENKQEQLNSFEEQASSRRGRSRRQSVQSLKELIKQTEGFLPMRKPLNNGDQPKTTMHLEVGDYQPESGFSTNRTIMSLDSVYSHSAINSENENLSGIEQPRTRANPLKKKSTMGFN